MRLRLALVAVLVCGAVALDGAVASAAKTGMYTGKTKQGYRIKIKVGKRSIDLKRFSIRLRCNNRSSLILDESGFLRTPLRKGGKFKDHQFGRTDDVYIRGRVRGNKVRGTVRVTDKTRRTKCRAKPVKFTAKLRKGR